MATKRRKGIHNFILKLIFTSLATHASLTYRLSLEPGKDHVAGPATSGNNAQVLYNNRNITTRLPRGTNVYTGNFPLLVHDNLRERDVFAASWWMRRERFLQTKVRNIVGVEQDAFIPILSAGRGRKDVRMTKDWLDFSLEHMSKWQKLIGTTTPGNSLVANILRKYSSKREPGSSFTILDTFMNTTLAVIPLGVNDKASGKVQDVWAAFLTATITSLLQHGIKRIVVVGYYNMDAILTSRVFSYFIEKAQGSAAIAKLTVGELPSQSYYIELTELGFVHTTNVVTSKVIVNVPKGALIGLLEEFEAKTDPRNTTANLHPNNDTIGSYLGWSHVSTDFDHVFLTEGDQVLHARLSPLFLQELQHNRVFVPHRLQPIPHKDDLKPILKPGSLKQLPENHPPVIDLTNSLTIDACCDSPEPYGQKTCESFWWICGYEGKSNFSYLDIFDFIRLSPGGTGVVSLAGNAHGRRCIAKPNGRGTC